MNLQSDGKIIVGGSTMQNGYAAITLARYMANGLTDSTFGNNGQVITQTGQASCVTSLVLQSDHKIVAAGYTFLNDSIYNFTALRYNTDGSPDGTFGNGGIALVDVENSPYAYNVAINGSGKIIMSGYSKKNSNIGISLVQLNSDGTPDTSFGTGGIALHHFGESPDVEAWAMALQADGKIVTAGLIYDVLLDYNKIAVIRFDVNGSLDTTFGAGGISKISVSSGSANHDDFANAIAIQPDGRIVIAGDAYIWPITHFALLRLTDTGALDTTFGSGGIVITDIGNSENSAYGVNIQADGKIIAVGECRDTTVSGGGNFALARYNYDGSPDMTFGNSGKVYTDIGGHDDYAYCVKEQADGKLIVSGISKGSIYYNFAIARYNGVSTSLPEYKREENFKIFPNPAVNKIAVTGLNNGIIDIYNIQGQCIKTCYISNTYTIIDVSELSTGVYFIKVSADKIMSASKQEIAVMKFVKKL